MEQGQLKNLNTTGIAKSAGGAYERIRTDGIATINGDTSCSSLTVNGQLKVEGSLQGGVLHFNGKSSIAGGLRAERLEIDGMLKIGGDMHVVNIGTRGMLKSEGNASGEHISSTGDWRVAGNAEFEKVELHGGFQIGGMLNAGTIKIGMAGPCKAKEIGGGTIEVRRRTSARKLLSFLAPGLAPRLTASLIEGDEIVLEDTQADIVRGNVVVIGSGCEIGRVEYKERLDRDPESQIGVVEQV